MKYSFWFLYLSLTLVTACGGGGANLTEEEKEKIKQAKLDSIVDLRLAEIDMNEVDTYPIFKGLCSESASKEEQKQCFVQHFSKFLQERLENEKIEVTEPILDTIFVNIKIDNNGKAVLENTEAKAKTKELLPTLDEDLADNLDEIATINPIQPATKHGVSISVQFRVPIVMNVK
ncbi:hypothetical protein [Capnocytophaga canis]|uniref:hypothetical protein n=1 Tax=Capnocytophaga canis TaxID=1848903 RepID=UPI0015621644|nr:hypothetical protein [Capnocytophaga canis]